MIKLLYVTVLKFEYHCNLCFSSLCVLAIRVTGVRRWRKRRFKIYLKNSISSCPLEGDSSSPSRYSSSTLPRIKLFSKVLKERQCLMNYCCSNQETQAQFTLAFQMRPCSWKIDSDGSDWQPSSADLLRRSICSVICGKTG